VRDVRAALAEPMTALLLSDVFDRAVRPSAQPERTFHRALMGARVVGAVAVSCLASTPLPEDSTAALLALRAILRPEMTPSRWSFVIDASLRLLERARDERLASWALLRASRPGQRAIHRWLTGFESALRHHGIDGVDEGLEPRTRFEVDALCDRLFESSAWLRTVRLEGEAFDTVLVGDGTAPSPCAPLLQRRGDDVWVIDGPARRNPRKNDEKKLGWLVLTGVAAGDVERVKSAGGSSGAWSGAVASFLDVEREHGASPWHPWCRRGAGASLPSLHVAPADRLIDCAEWVAGQVALRSGDAPVIVLGVEPGESAMRALETLTGQDGGAPALDTWPVSPTCAPTVVIAGSLVAPEERRAFAALEGWRVLIVTTRRAASRWPADATFELWRPGDGFEVPSLDDVDPGVATLVRDLRVGHADVLEVVCRGGGAAAALESAIEMELIDVAADGTLTVTARDSHPDDHDELAAPALRRARAPVAFADAYAVLEDLQRYFSRLGDDAGAHRLVAAHATAYWAVRLAAAIRLAAASEDELEKLRGGKARSALQGSLVPWATIAQAAEVGKKKLETTTLEGSQQAARLVVESFTKSAEKLAKCRLPLHAGADHVPDDVDPKRELEQLLEALGPLLQRGIDRRLPAGLEGFVISADEGLGLIDSVGAGFARFICYAGHGRFQITQLALAESTDAVRRVARLGLERMRLDSIADGSWSREARLASSLARARLAVPPTIDLATLVDRGDGLAANLAAMSSAKGVSFLALVGPSGVGKSAELARWVTREDGAAPSLRLLIPAARISKEGELLCALHTAATSQEDDAGEEQDRAGVDLPLLARMLTSFERLRIAIDGIDEAPNPKRCVAALVHDLRLLVAAGTSDSTTVSVEVVVTIRPEAPAELLESIDTAWRVRAGGAPGRFLVTPLADGPATALWETLVGGAGPNVEGQSEADLAPAVRNLLRNPRLAKLAARDASRTIDCAEQLIGNWMERAAGSELERTVLGRLALALWHGGRPMLGARELEQFDPALYRALKDEASSLENLQRTGLLRVVESNNEPLYSIGIDHAVEWIVGRRVPVAIDDVASLRSEYTRVKLSPALAGGLGQAIARSLIVNERSIDRAAATLLGRADEADSGLAKTVAAALGQVRPAALTRFLAQAWKSRQTFALGADARHRTHARTLEILRLAAEHGEQDCLVDGIVSDPRTRDACAAELAIVARHRPTTVSTVLRAAVERISWARPWTLGPAVGVALAIFTCLVFIDAPRSRDALVESARRLAARLGLSGGSMRLRPWLLSWVVASFLPRLDAWPQGPIPLLSEFRTFFRLPPAAREHYRDLAALFSGDKRASQLKDLLLEIAGAYSMPQMLLAERAMLRTLGPDRDVDAEDMLDAALSIGREVTGREGAPTMGGQSMLYVFWAYLRSRPLASPRWRERYWQFAELHDAWLRCARGSKYRYSSSTTGAKHKALFLVPRLALGARAGDQARADVLANLWSAAHVGATVANPEPDSKVPQLDETLTLDLLDEFRILAVGEHEPQLALEGLAPLLLRGRSAGSWPPKVEAGVLRLLAEIHARDPASTRRVLGEHGCADLLTRLPAPRPAEELGYALFLGLDQGLTMRCVAGDRLDTALRSIFDDVFEAPSFHAFVSSVVQHIVDEIAKPAR
jgi:hypothetical protein